jgi:hypothetical protein
MLSYVAYPDALEKYQREKFAVALTRRMHILASRFDKEWSHSLQQIRPYIFFDKQEIFEKHLRRGFRRVDFRLHTAFVMITPQLPTIEGYAPRKVDGFEPTVENVSIGVMNAIGWKGNSVATFKSRVWGPMRPICHLALAISNNVLTCTLKKNDLRARLDGLFPSIDKLRDTLLLAEEYRLMLPALRFRIKEADTVQFIEA